VIDDDIAFHRSILERYRSSEAKNFADQDPYEAPWVREIVQRAHAAVDADGAEKPLENMTTFTTESDRRTR